MLAVSFAVVVAVTGDGREQALLGEQLQHRVGRLRRGLRTPGLPRGREPAPRPGPRGQGSARWGGFASGRSIGERLRRASTFETMPYLLAAAPRRCLQARRFAGLRSLRYRRCAARVKRTTPGEARCSRPCCSRRTTPAFAPRFAASTKPACPRAMSRCASSTRRSTTRTRSPSRTRARSCAAGRWSPASTAPAPCSRRAIRHGRRATGSSTTAGASAKRAGVAWASARG